MMISPVVFRQHVFGFLDAHAWCRGGNGARPARSRRPALLHSAHENRYPW